MTVESLTHSLSLSLCVSVYVLLLNSMNVCNEKLFNVNFKRNKQNHYHSCLIDFNEKKLNKTTHRQTSAACRRRINGKKTRNTTIETNTFTVRRTWAVQFFCSTTRGTSYEMRRFTFIFVLNKIFSPDFLASKKLGNLSKILPKKKIWKILWKNGENGRQSCAWRTWQKTY